MNKFKTLMTATNVIFFSLFTPSCADLQPDTSSPVDPPRSFGRTVDREGRVPGEDTAFEVLRGLADNDGLCALVVKQEATPLKSGAAVPAVAQVFFNDQTPNRADEVSPYESVDIELQLMPAGLARADSPRHLVGLLLNDADGLAARLDVTVDGPLSQLKEAVHFHVTTLSATQITRRSCGDLVLTKGPDSDI